jgi:hypothetical protein
MLALAVGLGLAGLSGTAVADDTALEKLLVETASTPAQHEALAEYDSAKPAALKAEAADHRAMAKSYGGTKLASAQAMVEHCNELASLADAQAAEYEHMASMHAAVK